MNPPPAPNPQPTRRRRIVEVRLGAGRLEVVSYEQPRRCPCEECNPQTQTVPS